MALNREGIEQLKADLRANARHYNQNRFGTVKPECGTEACMAGMCLMRSIGMEEFTRRVKAKKGFYRFMRDCLDAAAVQLGMSLLMEEEYGRDGEGLPPIFSQSCCWPHDLRGRYEKAERCHDHEAMAEVACSALDRIDVHGLFLPKAGN